MNLRNAVLSLSLAAVAAVVLVPNPARADRGDHGRYERRDNRTQRHDNRYQRRDSRAQHYDNRYERRYYSREWHGRRDIRHFDRRGYHVWRGGRWHHGYHDGRLGWWWVVGTLWYFYPAPVYPYPNPYVPPGRYYYYCAPYGGYYPYVRTCPPGGWRLVPGP